MHTVFNFSKIYLEIGVQYLCNFGNEKNFFAPGDCNNYAILKIGNQIQKKKCNN